jgi:hypothetical protein
MTDLIIENGAPDGDHIHISDTTGTWNVTVWRDEHGEVHVVVADNTATEQRTYILGHEDTDTDTGDN